MKTILSQKIRGPKSLRSKKNWVPVTIGGSKKCYIWKRFRVRKKTLCWKTFVIRKIWLTIWFGFRKAWVTKTILLMKKYGFVVQIILDLTSFINLPYTLFTPYTFQTPSISHNFNSYLFFNVAMPLVGGWQVGGSFRYSSHHAAHLERF